MQTHVTVGLGVEVGSGVGVCSIVGVGARAGTSTVGCGVVVGSSFSEVGVTVGNGKFCSTQPKSRTPKNSVKMNKRFFKKRPEKYSSIDLYTD